MGGANWSPIIVTLYRPPHRSGGGLPAEPHDEIDNIDRAFCASLRAAMVSILVIFSVPISWDIGRQRGEDAAWAEAFAARQAHWEPYEYTYKGRVKTASRRVLGPARYEAPLYGAR